MPKHENICIRKFESSDLDDVKSLIYRTIDVCYRPVYNEESVNFFKEWHCDEKILKGGRPVPEEIKGVVFMELSLV